MLHDTPRAPRDHVHCDGKQINPNAFAVPSPHEDRGLRKLCRIQSQDGRLCDFTMYYLCCGSRFNRANILHSSPSVSLLEYSVFV
ncbi:hypothetical protein QQF64_029494 [Cirrhinus molitorella]|uniref:Uncharacterized protein n=1 Tax=Cirrhinus molitorella TaxID=172907 RepID=A0ABR3N0S2_9TELE